MTFQIESIMANKTLFKSVMGKLIPQTDALNEEHAPAYAFSPKQTLAQYAATGCLNATFYASAEEQLQTECWWNYMVAGSSPLGSIKSGIIPVSANRSSVGRA